MGRKKLAWLGSCRAGPDRPRKKHWLGSEKTGLGGRKTGLAWVVLSGTRMAQGKSGLGRENWLDPGINLAWVRKTWLGLARPERGKNAPGKNWRGWKKLAWVGGKTAWAWVVPSGARMTQGKTGLGGKTGTDSVFSPD